MREYTLRFWVPDGNLHGYAEEYAAHPDLEPGYTHQVEVLDDGTVTTLSEVPSPPELVEEYIGGAEKTIDIIVSDGPPTFYYLHFEPNPIEREIMAAPRKTSITIKEPAEPQEDGSVIVTFVGDQRDVGDAAELVPEEVKVEVVSIRELDGQSKDVFADLTGRQREVLSVAVEMGYYEDPRAVTQDDIADELDVSSATVGEHLRRIEREILGSFGG